MIREYYLDESYFWQAYYSERLGTLLVKVRHDCPWTCGRGELWTVDTDGDVALCHRLHGAGV
jgi:hypothetical protein